MGWGHMAGALLGRGHSTRSHSSNFQLAYQGRLLFSLICGMPGLPDPGQVEVPTSKDTGKAKAGPV